MILRKASLKFTGWKMNNLLINKLIEFRFNAISSCFSHNRALLKI